MKVIKTGKKTIGQLDKILWPLFSEFIRRRAAKEFSGGERAKCFTCDYINTRGAYGKGTSDLIEQKSKTFCKPMPFEYEKLIQEYKTKLLNLKK